MNRTGVNPAYWEIVRLKLIERVTYPIDLLGSWSAFPLVLLIYYVVYGSVYAHKPDFAGMTFTHLILYLGIAFVFRKMSEGMGESSEVEEEIKRGEIFTYLARPIHYFGVRLSRQFGKFLSRGIIGIPLIYISALVFFQITLPIERFILGIALALIGSIVIFQIYYCMGLLAFWFEETWGFRRGIFTVAWLLSGSAVPIALLPEQVKTISFLLPFQHQAAIPAQFILGQIGIGTYAQSLLIIIGWILVMGVIQNQLWKKGLLKYDGKG